MTMEELQQALASVSGAQQSGMTLEKLQQAMAAMPPAEREALLANLFRDYQGEQDVLGQQQRRAQALRNTPDPRMRNAGAFRVAANPLEFVGSTGLQGLGEFEQQRNIGTGQGLAQDRSAATRALAEALARRMPGATGALPGQLNPRGGI